MVKVFHYYQHHLKIPKILVLVCALSFNAYALDETVVCPKQSAHDEESKTLEAICSDVAINDFLNNSSDRLSFDAPDRIQRQRHFEFYRDYLAKYYPKAFVITEGLFPFMTPESVEAGLAKIVEIFAYKPWFYFLNKPQGFKITRYWELIVDQLSWISDFLGKAYVDTAAGKIMVPSEDEELLWFFSFSSMFADKDSAAHKKPLLEWLTTSGKTVVYTFYALSYDYVVKLFNEAILLSDQRTAKKYFSELEWIAKKIHGSQYEADYQEHIKTAQELLDLLKNTTEKYTNIGNMT